MHTPIWIEVVMRYEPGMIALAQCNTTAESFRARLLEVAEVDDNGFAVMWYDLAAKRPVSLPDLPSVRFSWGIVERPEFPADWRERLARLSNRRWPDVDNARAAVQTALGLPETFGRIAPAASVTAGRPGCDPGVGVREDGRHASSSFGCP